MFRLANDGVIDEAAIDQWAQSIHLNFVSCGDNAGTTEGSNSDPSNEIYYISKHLEETTFSHYVSVVIQSQNVYACHDSTTSYSPPVERGVLFTEHLHILGTQQVGLQSALSKPNVPKYANSSNTRQGDVIASEIPFKNRWVS